jgi:hypothetical protein
LLGAPLFYYFLLFCKQLLSVPGGKNKMMAWMAKHMSLTIQAKMNEKMVRKAINTRKI